MLSASPGQKKKDQKKGNGQKDVQGRLLKHIDALVKISINNRSVLQIGAPAFVLPSLSLSVSIDAGAAAVPRGFHHSISSAPFNVPYVRDAVILHDGATTGCKFRQHQKTHLSLSHTHKLSSRDGQEAAFLEWNAHRALSLLYQACGLFFFPFPPQSVPLRSRSQKEKKRSESDDESIIVLLHTPENNNNIPSSGMTCNQLAGQGGKKSSNANFLSPDLRFTPSSGLHPFPHTTTRVIMTEMMIIIITRLPAQTSLPPDPCCVWKTRCIFTQQEGDGHQLTAIAPKKKKKRGDYEEEEGEGEN